MSRPVPNTPSARPPHFTAPLLATLLAAELIPLPTRDSVAPTTALPTLVLALQFPNLSAPEVILFHPLAPSPFALSHPPETVRLVASHALEPADFVKSKIEEINLEETIILHNGT